MVEIFLYEKENSGVPSGCSSLLQRTHCISLPNWGRESFAYLTHITSRYGQLAPKLVFAQAAAPGWGFSNFPKMLGGHMAPGSDFFWDYASPYTRPHIVLNGLVHTAAPRLEFRKQDRNADAWVSNAYSPWQVPELCPSGDPNTWNVVSTGGPGTDYFYYPFEIPEPDMPKSFAAFWDTYLHAELGPVPVDLVAFAQGAVLSTDAQSIRKHPRAFYERLKTTVAGVNRPVSGYHLEFTWGYIFGFGDEIRKCLVALKHDRLAAQLTSSPLIPHSPLIPPATASEFRHEVTQAVKRKSSCVPYGTVMISAFNKYHLPLRRIQMSSVAGFRCLMDRFVSLGWDAHDEHGVVVSAPSVAASDFRKEAYHEIIWAKWSLIQLAMSGVGAASFSLFVDADEVIVSNPFAVRLPERLWGSQLLYTGEVVCTPFGERCAINGGLLFVYDVRVSESALSSKPSNFDKNTSLDQDLVAPAFARDGIKMVNLPWDEFFCNCYRSQAIPLRAHNVDWQRVKVFHANCIANQADKEARMQEFLAVHQAGSFGPRALSESLEPSPSPSPEPSPSPSPELSSQVINVSPGAGTLQVALNSASAGDELVLADGNYTYGAYTCDPAPDLPGSDTCYTCGLFTYRGPFGCNYMLEIDKDITIRALNPGQAVLEGGGGVRRVIQVGRYEWDGSITSGTVALNGLTITKGYGVSALASFEPRPLRNLPCPVDVTDVLFCFTGWRHWHLGWHCEHQ